MTRVLSFQPTVLWGVKWLMLTIAFVWLVGCQAMNKNMQDPFLSASNEFSCGEPHKGSAKSARSSKNSAQANQARATSNSAQMNYGFQASSGMDPATADRMSQAAYRTAARPATPPVAKKAAVEDPFASDDWAQEQVASDDTGRVSF